MCQRVVEDTTRMIETVRVDELSKATPCSAWDVRALINHMIGGVYAFTQALEGEKLEQPGEVPDMIGDNAVESYRAAATAMMDAWRQPGAMDRTLALPPGDVPAPVAIGITLMEHLVHTWDLARALGRSSPMDPELASVALETLGQMIRPEFRGPGMPFGPEVPCPETAPVQDRLIAFTGRRP